MAPLPLALGRRSLADGSTNTSGSADVKSAALL